MLLITLHLFDPPQGILSGVAKKKKNKSIICLFFPIWRHEVFRNDDDVN